MEQLADKPFNKEQWVDFAKEAEVYFERQVPNPGNLCKTEGCTGHIIKKVSGIYQGRYNFHTPECGVCSRQYTKAEHVPPVGIAEFRKMMDEPFTI